MTPEDKLHAYKTAWVRQIRDVVGPGPRAQEIVALAELNGLFDPLKTLYAQQPTLNGPDSVLVYDPNSASGFRVKA